MSSHCRSVLVIACLPHLLCAGDRVLRVCADPNNLPYSNQRGEGFENRLAELAARDLGATLEYVWWSQRKSFLRDSLNAGKCDAVLGVPATLDSVEVTRPYYRSTYVFLTRADRQLQLTALSDPRLEQCRIGIHVVDNDYAPPAQALARRGLGSNLSGYSLFGKYGEENPPARLVEAVAHGDVDVAVIWGPFAGYFAKQSDVPLQVTAVSPAAYMGVPFTYSIAAAVRKGDDTLRDALNGVLVRECTAVRALLEHYGVPLVEEEGKCAPSQ